MDKMCHYMSLIEKRRNETVKGYSENHHIIPECQGGQDTPENKVRLTPREHFIAHQLLVKMYPGHPGLIHAAFRMSRNRRYSSRIYAWLRERHSKMMSERSISEETRKRMKESQTGKIKSKETKKKMSDSHKGKILTKESLEKRTESRRGIIVSEDTRKKIGKAHKGKEISEEHRKKISEANTGKIFSEEHRNKISESKRKNHG